MDSSRFIIAEFYDGLQLIPAAWYNADKLSCIWPSHFKTKLRINKAIMAKEIPQEKSDWEELPIKKIYGTANTYEEGIDKLVRAEDTSNVDDTAISSNERKQQEKKRRRVKAKRHFSSSSEDLSSAEDKENNIKKGKVVPALPRKEDFTKKQLLDTREMTVHANTFMNTGSSNDANNVFTNNITRRVEHSAAETHNEHLDTCDFKKHIIWKLNKVLYKLENIENRLHILQEQRQSANEFCKTQEMNIYFPICTIPDLTSVEEKLKEEDFQNDVLHFFKVVGESTAYIMIRNIFKKTISDNVTKHFNWTGKKDKQSFKDLRLSKIIIQAVRMTYKEMTDSDIIDYISKWLAQASIRIQREKNEENSGK